MLASTHFRDLTTAPSSSSRHARLRAGLPTGPTSGDLRLPQGRAAPIARIPHGASPFELGGPYGALTRYRWGSELPSAGE